MIHFLIFNNNRYGPIRQIRLGTQADTKGKAFVVYEDIFDAKTACDSLPGFNVGGRYIVVLYYQASKAFAVADREKKRAELEKMKDKYGVDGEAPVQQKKRKADE